nr:metallophosphoesterase [uncultured Desulfobacter sp.]
MNMPAFKPLILTGLAALTAVAFLGLPGSATAASGGRQGLFLTELYPNDISRSSVYGNSDDQLEYVEVFNTTDTDISFNDAYELDYEYPSGDDWILKQLTVKTIDGSTGVVIGAQKSAVFWNRRDDLGTSATEAQFRESWHISDDVKIFVVSGQNGFAADNRGFALVEKAAGEIVSHYRYTTGVDTSDGLAVQLAIPDSGSEMAACEQNTFGSPGTVSSEQFDVYSGSAPDDLTPAGLFITEIRPNDTSRGSAYGDSGSNDYMECMEVFNAGDEDIDFNTEYAFAYLYKANFNIQPVTTYENAVNANTGDTSGVIIPAHGAAVIWCYRAEGLSGSYTSFPTQADFRAAYNIPDNVPVYAQTGQNGWGNTDRGIALLKKEDDGRMTTASYYFWNGVTDLKDNKSVDLTVDLDGPKMSIYAAQSTTNMGTVAPYQYQFRTDDGTSPALTLLDESQSIAQGDFLRIPYEFKGGDTLPVNAINLYYKLNGQDTYSVASTVNFSIYNKYYAFIDNSELLNAEHVDYYLKAYNDYRTTVTDVRRITIVQDSSYNGIRVNFDNVEATDDAVLSGTVSVSAKDFISPGSGISLALDGSSVTTTTSLERSAYFTFEYSGVDAYFKNGLTSGDKVIAVFAKCSEIPSTDAMAIPVPQGYFTYNVDGSASIELSLRAGTWGSTFEADTDGNNDDFTAGNFQLKFTDGTVILPDTAVDMNGDTVDAASTVKMGDSSDCTTHVTMTFTIPADKVDAVAFALNTALLSDGTHTLTASGSETKEITFTVLNTVTPQDETTTADVNVAMTVDKENRTASVTTNSDVSTVSIYEARDLDIEGISEGAGDSTALAVSRTGTGATVSNNGDYPYQILEIPVKSSDITALRVKVNAQADYGQAVRLFILDPDTETWDLIDNTTESNGVITGVASLAGHTSNGTAMVLIQARGSEYAPYASPDMYTTTSDNNDAWDGTGIPAQYDFSIAWITDTQYYAEQYMDNFTSMTDWIVDNADALGIEYVIHTGDIVDEFNEEYEYVNASEELAKFEDAGIPYGVLAGNHDVAHGNMRYDLYWKYFGANRYKNSPVYVGTYKNNLGHYDLVTVNGEELLFLYMSWDIYTPETDWMNEILAKFPDRKAIICIHGGINSAGAQSYTSNLVLENVCKNNKNVFAVINGHYHGASLNIVGFDDDGDGENDRTVYQICTDYQSAPEGGMGYIKMIYFDLSHDKIYMNSYSPVLDDYNYFDTPKLDSYGIGTVAADIDIAELPVDFDRATPKTLTVSSVSVTGLTGVELGSAAAAGNAVTDVSYNLKVSANNDIYAVLNDAGETAVGYTAPVTVKIDGDYDLDGDVDKDDVALLRKYLRKDAATYPIYDLNGDGKISTEDMRQLSKSCTLSGCRRP